MPSNLSPQQLSDPMQAYDPATGQLLHPNPDPAKYQVATDGPNAGRYVPKPGPAKQLLTAMAPLAAPAGAALGAAFLPGLLGGGGGGAAGAGAAGTGASMTAQQMYDAGMMAGPSATTAALGGVGPHTWMAGAAAGAGAGAGGGNAAAAAGGSLANFLKDPKTYASIAGLLTTLASKPGGGSGGSGDAFSQNPQLQHLLDVSSQRVDRTDPLHQAVTQLAMQRLPTNVQR